MLVISVQILVLFYFIYYICKKKSLFFIRHKLFHITSMFEIFFLTLSLSFSLYFSFRLNYSIEIAEYYYLKFSLVQAVRAFILFFFFSLLFCLLIFFLFFICFEVISIPALSAIYFNSFEEYNLLYVFFECVACARDFCVINAYCVEFSLFTFAFSALHIRYRLNQITITGYL